MTVRVSWDVGERLISDEQVEAAVEAALVHGDRAGLDVDVVLVDDELLQELHGRFLDDPTPTDVMAFDLCDGELGDETGASDAEFEPAAEIYASVDCARRVAATRGEDPRTELTLYLVHGALHLCGFDDHEDDERAAMREAEARVLEGLRANRP